MSHIQKYLTLLVWRRTQKDLYVDMTIPNFNLHNLWKHLEKFM